MTEKPSHEEMEERVRQLEKKLAEGGDQEARLRASAERWRFLIEEAPSLIMVVDRDGIIQYINHVVPGLDVEEVVGTSHYDYLDPEYHGAIKEAVERVIETGQPLSWEVRGLGPNGRQSWYRARVGLTTRDDPSSTVTIIATDVTEHKEAEETLQRSEASYRRLVETMNEGLGIIDRDGVLTYVNEKVGQILGYSREEMMGRPVTDFLDDANRKIFEQQVGMRETGSPGCYEIMCTGGRAQGSYNCVGAGDV